MVRFSLLARPKVKEGRTLAKTGRDGLLVGGWAGDIGQKKPPCKKLRVCSEWDFKAQRISTGIIVVSPFLIYFVSQ